VIYAGPDPIPASGFFELKSGCYQRGLSANLEWKKSDGTWSIVSDAKGWDEISSCPSSVPVRPWTATLMTLSPGTEYRWNLESLLRYRNYSVSANYNHHQHNCSTKERKRESYYLSVKDVKNSGYWQKSKMSVGLQSGKETVDLQSNS
jgi:hypothetical protein